MRGGGLSASGPIRKAGGGGGGGRGEGAVRFRPDTKSGGGGGGGGGCLTEKGAVPYMKGAPQYGGVNSVEW